MKLRPPSARPRRLQVDDGGEVRQHATLGAPLLATLLALDPAARGTARLSRANTPPLACDVSDLPVVYKEETPDLTASMTEGSEDFDLAEFTFCRSCGLDGFCSICCHMYRSKLRQRSEKRRNSSKRRADQEQQADRQSSPMANHPTITKRRRSWYWARQQASPTPWLPPVSRD
ncbi:hypothetical protein ZWY2020_057421 [Hordeum vulgare]|nr:hypothetical protein ZWY2020_057421 [Hordeum vulgare]